MRRTLYNSLIKWKNSPDRRPLILNGARQVGKTWLLNEFARNEYSKFVMLSLDRDKKAQSLFKSDCNVGILLRGMSALSGVDITPGDTLVVLDEIQDCPEALTALKYFCEDAPDIHIAVAGSLLGISLHQQSSFPVGKVDILRLYPMDFEEFLRALNYDKLADELAKGDWTIINMLSDKYIELLRQYYYVGGMPMIVNNYVKQNSLTQVRRLQQELLADYEQDFSKHAPANEVPRIRMVWQNIPSQLAKDNKKFIYGALRKGARAAAFEMAIQWLIDAGLVYKINHISKVSVPLKFYEDHNAFKLFVCDVGLLGAMVNAPADAILVDNKIFSEYKGAFTESFVASQLSSSSIPAFYHSVESSRIELDFVVQLGLNVFPVEVKAEENLQSKSMKTFIQKHPNLKGIRLSMRPRISQDWLECMPLYGFKEEFIRMATGI